MSCRVITFVLFSALLVQFHPSLRNGIPIYVSKDERAVLSEVDNTNESLMLKSGKLKKIYEKFTSPDQDVLLKGHETIVFDAKNQMFAITEFSKVIQIKNYKKKDKNDPYKALADTTIVADLGNGRPLGGAFDKKGNLYVADAILGLIQVPVLSSKSKKNEKTDEILSPDTVKILATNVTLEDGSISPILFADDVTIGPKTGFVYFTDACDFAPEKSNENEWDVMYASKLNALHASKTGRILRYNPSNGEVDILATGIFFANGISTNKDETYLVVAETFQARLLKYHLKGEKEGTLEVLVDNLVGYPDGVDCSKKTGNCYAVIPSAKATVVDLLSALPPMLDLVVRCLFMLVPKSIAPGVNPIGCVVEVDAEKGELLQTYQDPHGDDIAALYGVTVNNEKLYFGSLSNDFIGVYNLK